MRVAALLVVCLVALARAGDDVDVETETQFTELVAKNDYVLVMFYAPWCGHCKSFKPAFAAAATKALGRFVLAKVDCTLEALKGLCQEQDVRGYPTIKFFKTGKAQEYNGPRETDGVLAWLEKKTGPAVVTLTEGEVAAYLSAHPTVVVGRFAEAQGPESDFVAAANDADLEEFKFVQVVGSSKASITLHAKGLEAQVHPEGENIARWAFEHSFPLVDEVGGHNFGKYAKLAKPLHLVFVEPTDEHKERIIADLTTVAAEHKDESFSWIDAAKYRAQIKASILGMGASGAVVPCIIRLSSFGSDNKPVVFEQPLTLDSLRDWAQGVKSGKYQYVPKSEPIPENNTAPVMVLVGKNWNEVVNDASKHVLVEFYAPWCGHCKSLAPKYDVLGGKFVGSSDVVIAKIDATANDVEHHIDLKGFPTIALYPKDAKTTPIIYNGDREADAIKTWLDENAK